MEGQAVLGGMGRVGTADTHWVLCCPVVVVMGAPTPSSKAVREGVQKGVTSKLMIHP